MTVDLSLSNARRRARAAFAPIAKLPGRALLTFVGWGERFRLRRELDTLRLQGELERTLLDSGIAPSDVPRLMRAHPRTLEQLATMMRRLGIDRTALARRPAVAEALRAMEWRCGECVAWRKCHDWLASPDEPGSYRAFCPNAEFLDELRCAESAAPGTPFRKPRGVLAELNASEGVDGVRG